VEFLRVDATVETLIRALDSWIYTLFFNGMTLVYTDRQFLDAGLFLWELYWCSVNSVTGAVKGGLA
jgi:hypothetical protein